MGQAPVVSHSPWTWHSSCYATPEYVWDNVLLSDCWSLNEPVGHMISLCPDLISSNQSQAPVDEWKELEKIGKDKSRPSIDVCAHNM